MKKKMNFFKRFKTAIFNLDEYGNFIDEKFTVSLKYILLLIIFVTLILSCVMTYEFTTQIKKGINYLENEFPDFKFENSKLELDNYVDGYDKEYDFLIIADTTNNIDASKLKEYTNKTKNVKNSLILLEDKFIYKVLDSSVEYKYMDLSSVFNLNDSNKQNLLEQYHSLGGTSSISTIYMIVMVISLFFINLTNIIADCLIVGLVGIIVARICGIIIKTSVAGTLAIYSLTLPIICSLLYSIALQLFGFEIKYFEAMYLMIAYIYIIAAILIIKTDLIKQGQELQKIKDTEKKIKQEIAEEELERERKKEKEKNENGSEKNDEKDDNKEDEPKPKLKEKEPDGSEI